MFVIVVGCGQIGANLAKQLMQDNHDVVVVDSDAQRFDRLGSGFNGLTIAGIPIDEDILRSAGIERADALAAVTSKDNLNAMVAQIASNRFHVPRVITRIHDQSLADMFSGLGLVTISPTTLAVNQLNDLLTNDNQDEYHSVLGTPLCFRRVRPSKRWLGKPVADYADGKVLGLVRGDRLVLVHGTQLIGDEDVLLVAEYAERGGERS